MVARLLRLAHTLKGAARVVKQPAIAELAHAAEGLLTRHRGSAQPLAGDDGSELLRRLDEIGALVHALDGPDAGEARSVAPTAVEEPLETVRVDLQEMDGLLRGINDASVHVGAVRAKLGAGDRVRDLARRLRDRLAPRPGDHGTATTAPAVVRARELADDLGLELDRLVRDLATDVERVEGALAEIHDVAHRLRLIPAQTAFPSLDRAVRDAAVALGKQVDFETVGGDVRLDAQVLASLHDALMHVVRNAVAHGIEPELDRVTAGKPRRGRIRLVVGRRGGRASFVCEDDGRGIDLEAVRTAAVTRGLVDPTTAASIAADELLALLRTGGLTTSTSVTQLSGRGIGLDVVRATMARLKGEFTICSHAGRGATIELQVPISIASLPGLVVEVAGTTAAIPLDAVRQTLRVDDGDIARSADRQSIVHDGTVIPFLPLERALRRPRASGRQRRVWSAVVVHAGGRGVAVGVDRLLGTATIVMRALPAMVEADPVIAGVALDAEGHPRLVLDADGLVAAWTYEALAAGALDVLDKPVGEEPDDVGIATEDVGRLFTEFEQLDAGTAKRHAGAGLGLALTRRLVEAQGGSVGVHSALGVGSTFHAVLPRRASQGRPLPSPRVFAAAPGAPVILVVEDREDDQVRIARALTDAGYGVETAATGAQALARCQDRRFDAITLDLLLPDGSGLEVLQALRDDPKHHDVPVVVITVVTERGAIGGLPVHDVLSKPVDEAAMLASLQRAGCSVAVRREGCDVGARVVEELRSIPVPPTRSEG